MRSKLTVRTLVFLTALAVIAGMTPRLSAEQALQITSPVDGSVVNPGQPMDVVVSVSGEFTGVYISGQAPIGFSQIVKAPPYTFSLTIPLNIRPGRYKLTVLGGRKSSANPVRSEPITVDVELPDQPKKIRVEQSSLRMQVGDQSGLHVIGIYSDGRDVDLSRSTQTTYETQRQDIVSVTDEGLVTALAIGSTTVVIDHRIIVNVQVVRSDN